MIFEDDMEGILEEYGSEKAIEAVNRERAASEDKPESTGVLIKDYPLPQRELDLHGMTIPEALKEIDYFIARSIDHRTRTVKIITGKGLHSKDMLPVLRAETEKRLGELRRDGKVFSFKREKAGGAFIVYLVS